MRHHFPLNPPAFFSYTDNLQDLRLLLQHVEDSETLVILQSRKVLTRPWVILELYTALTHDVPIVALNIQNAFRYDYSQALEFMMYFDQEIEIANPGAAQLLIEQGVDPRGRGLAIIRLIAEYHQHGLQSKRFK